MIGNTLIDNSENLKLADTIKEILKNPKINHIDIATGYWDIPGTAVLADELNAFLARDNTKLRLLIGKDPYLFAQYNKNPKYKDIKNWPEEFIRTDINEIEVKPEYENAVSFLLKYLGKTDKIEIHIFKKNENEEKQFLHSKCYIFYGKGISYGIIGSSNFTEKGLKENSELNYLETLSQIITAEPNGINVSKGHIFWFNEKWALSEDWSKEFLEQILRPSSIAKKVLDDKKQKNTAILNYTVLSPYETYIKFLIDQFDEIISFNGKITPDDYMPKDPNFKRLTYQAEAVNQGFSIMKQHHGFILADVVGLGKTFTALMVAKRHLLETGFKNPVLIITPPAIKQSWIDSIEYFDKGEVSEKKIHPFITLTTIGCIDDVNETGEYIAENDFDSAFKKEEYGMIIVDESHRFRNASTIMYQKLDDLIGSINPQPYIVLLSATPQNNEPYDLRNQIYLFQREHNRSTLQNLGKFGNKLENYFAEKHNNYKEYIKKEKTVDGKKIPKTKEELAHDKAALIADSEDIRKRIVEPLVIRRTRTDIELFYQEDMKNQGLSFPKIQKPVAIPYEMNGELGNLFNNTINIIAPQVSHVDSDENGEPVLDFGATAGEDGLGYYRYRAIEFLKSEENRRRHEINNLSVTGTSQRLAQIMELLLVKRLESSQSAFKESLHNLHRYTENMIKMWNADRIFICPDLNVNKELNDENISKNGTFEQTLCVLAEKAKKANKKNSGDGNEGPNQEYKRADFFDSYIENLNNDLRLIDELCTKWDVQTSDPKMSTFIFETARQFLDPKRNKNNKLIIFTECIATQKALVQKLNEMPIPNCNVLSITAKNRDNMKEIIAANFDANYKGTKKDDYQILITTDVLAEGVNLHRSNSILNYDSPWNATRLMQRLGRINRIGTDAKKIWNYNFYPSTLGDSQINLKNRTYVKLQAFHELFGEDSQIYSSEEEVKHFDKVIRDEAQDSETPIMPFIAELREFKKNNESNYVKLSSIGNTIVSTTQSENKKAFSELKETDKNSKALRSSLYISNEDGIATKVSQLEFFETLKPLSTLKETETDITLIEKYRKSVINCYAADKQNAELSMKSKLRKGDKEISAAIKKIKSLYNFGLPEIYEEKLDEISNSIRDKNFSLINKVLEMNFKNEGLGTIQIEADIDYLHKYTHAHSSESEANIAIEFIVK